jgi:hypothetical protein
MRQSLILLVVLGALLLMPKERTHQAGYASGTPPSPTSTSVPTATPVPPVVFMGDSVTMGAFASTPDNAFVVRVDNDLKARGIDATNDCVWTLDPYSDLKNAKRVAGEHRQLIILEIGVHWAAFDAAQFRELYGSMLDCLAGSGARLVVGTIPWLNWQPGTPSYFEMAFDSQIIREEAAKRGIPVADLWAVTDLRADAISRPDQPCFTGPTCRGDNYHPGDVGHALIAEAYSRALDTALANPPPPSEGRCDFDAYLDALAKGEPVRVRGP